MFPRLFLYNFVIIIIGILTLPWIIYQLIFVKKRRPGLAQRFGYSPVIDKKPVWCHAVSVGEVKAIAPMLVLLQENERTRDRLVLSTVTLTGQETANRECGFVRRIFYFPLDLLFVVGRAIRCVNPEVFITAETEIWPNFFSVCFRKDIPVIIVNGRISDRSLSRYLRFRWFFRPILQRVRLFLMQSEEDARRITEMGARPESVMVTGNMKYDRLIEPTPLPKEVKRWAESGFLFVAGSTHSGEEEIVLQSVSEPDQEQILLALVPRHPERFIDVADLLERENIPFTRYSEVQKGNAIKEDILLVDAMGVLDGFYALADAAFVGGSLVPVGGHNLLEPAMHGVPILTGPYTHNFRDISHHLIDADACIIVKNTEELKKEIVDLKNNTQRLSKMGRSAKDATKILGGASTSNASSILQILEISSDI